MNQVDFSIVIPTHLRSANVVRLLESLEKLTYPKENWEVAVVSNLEDPQLSAAMAPFNTFNLRLEIVGEVGVNRARNLGLKKARGTYVFFLDDDCEILDPEHLEKLKALHLSRSGCVAVGGSYRLPSGSRGCEKAYHFIASQWFEKQKSEESGEVKNLLGGNVCYKKTVLLETGLFFDDTIAFGAAESEFHDRLVQNGLKLCADGPPVLHHLQMTWLQFTQKAYLQGCGSSKRQLDSYVSDQWSWLFVFWRMHYQRYFNQGRHNALQYGYLESLERLPTLSLKAIASSFFLYISMVPLVLRLMTFAYWFLYRSLGQVWVAIKVALIRSYWVSWGLFCRARIFLYWKIFAMVSFVRLKLIRTYWFFHYLRFQFHKDILKKLELIHLGIDPSIMPQALPLATGPSYFLPAAESCTGGCKYCPQMKSIQPTGGPRPEATSLAAQGLSQVTFSCSYFSLAEQERLALKKKYGDLKQEVFMNPDAISHWNFEAFADLQVLLLFRPTEMFRQIYQDLKKQQRNDWRILFIFEISGDPKKMEKWLAPEDWSRVQLLNVSDSAPEVTDERNRRFLPKLGHLLGCFSRGGSGHWPAVSHLHAPFLVGDSALAHHWIEGELRWQSPASLGSAHEASLQYSVIVPVRYQLDYAQLVLANLARQNFDLNQFEIVLVDDGNAEDLSLSIQQAFQEIGEPPIKVKVVRFPRETSGGFDSNYRAGQARNMGLRFSKGQRILFVDSDILVSPHLFLELESVLKDNMIVQFPRYMLTREATQNFEKYEDVDLSRDTYSQSSYWEEFKKTQNWEDLKNYWKYTCTYGLAITRKTLEMTGPFRADYIFYGFEDVDLGYRVFQNHGRFVLHKTPVFHLYPDEQHSFHFDPEKRYQALSKSASLFFRRNMDLNFYFDLKGFLNRPWYIRARKPYYFLKYQWDKIRMLLPSRRSASPRPMS